MRDISQIAGAIDEALPDVARDVIQTYLDLNVPANAAFLRNPDGREQHQTHWHQWGIITHTRKFLRYFDEEIPEYLKSWNVWEPVEATLCRTIDEVSRWDLLRISILLHDIGKFAARTEGKKSFHFAQHERRSGEIIRGQLNLRAYDLTPGQIEYIALTAEDHFVLGLMRKRAREQGVYDEEFTRTVQFRQVAQEVREQHPADYIEIGVLFLGDSLAKADPSTGPHQAVSQHDVNIAVARQYLQSVAGDPSL